MKSALVAFTYFGLIYGGCFWFGARERIETQEAERNGGWFTASGATLQMNSIGPLAKPRSATGSASRSISTTR